MARSYSLKIATLDDNAQEDRILIETEGLTAEQVAREVAARIEETPPQPDAEVPLAFDITIQRDAD